MEIEAVATTIVNTAAERLALYEELTSLAQEEREFLVSGRHSELADNISGQDRVIAEIDQLDRQEETLLGELGPERVAPSLDDSYRQISARTMKAAANLKAIAQDNTMLLANTMEYVGFSMNVLVQLAADHQDSQSNPALVLDRKV